MWSGSHAEEVVVPRKHWATRPDLVWQMGRTVMPQRDKRTALPSERMESERNERRKPLLSLKHQRMRCTGRRELG